MVIQIVLWQLEKIREIRFGMAFDKALSESQNVVFTWGSFSTNPSVFRNKMV